MRISWTILALSWVYHSMQLIVPVSGSLIFHVTYILILSEFSDYYAGCSTCQN
jgi:hypothetical protein